MKDRGDGLLESCGREQPVIERARSTASGNPLFPQRFFRFAGR
jgi:hypothetical protein